MITTTYVDIINRNPIVSFSINGYQRSAWYNMVKQPSAGAQTFHIYIFANTAREATTLANALKAHLENNAITTNGIKDDISIGLAKPILDRLTHAYVIKLTFLAGQLRMFGSSSVPPKKPSPFTVKKYVVHNSVPVTNIKKYITN